MWIGLTLAAMLLVVTILTLHEMVATAEQTNGAVRLLAVLMFSTFLFGTAMSVFTHAEGHEILVASATYCAIQIIFDWTLCWADC